MQLSSPASVQDIISTRRSERGQTRCINQDITEADGNSSAMNFRTRFQSNGRGKVRGLRREQARGVAAVLAQINGESKRERKRIGGKGRGVENRQQRHQQRARGQTKERPRELGTGSKIMVRLYGSSPPWPHPIRDALNLKRRFRARPASRLGAPTNKLAVLRHYLARESKAKMSRG